ncbi:MAG: BamA/TamA family outer membrane protein [Candidatus Latescibacterota bacterium]
MYRKIWLSLTIAIVAFSFAGASGAKTFTRAEEKVISAEGIKQIRFSNIQFTDLIYRGSDSTENFKIKFERRADVSNENDAENLFSEIALDTHAEGGNLDIRLTSPDQRNNGIFGRWFKKEEKWRVIIEVTGPSKINMYARAEYSTLQTILTEGILSLTTDFSTSTVTGHRGKLQVNADFSVLNGDEINGLFDVVASFSHISLLLSELGGDSAVTSSFGGMEIGLPVNTGAVFSVRKAFSGIHFDTSGRMSSERGNRRTLNGGGPVITLNSDYGHIRIKDNTKQYETVPVQAVYDESEIVPLNDKAWWRYAVDGKFITMRAETRQTVSGDETTLSFDNRKISPFGSITVHKATRGLFLNRIDGSFFGRNITGVTFDPPKLWLPYSKEDSLVSESEIPGSVHIQAFGDSVDTPAGKMNNVISYTLEARGIQNHRIQLVPGVGFISLDEAKLVAYDLAYKNDSPKSSEEKPSSPLEFEKGFVQSIRIYGNHLRSSVFILNKLTIKEGEVYTKEEVEKAVKALEDDKMIEYTSYAIDIQGNLRIHIYEVEPYKKSFSLDLSYSRVSGVGIGPGMKITSTVAPLSEIYGKARYHWGNKDWTWEAGGFKQFFDKNKLRIGGSYLFDFGSNMDWAVPPDEASLNAFLLGRELVNYYHIEEGRGFVSQTIGDNFRARVDYFQSTYGSVEKKTNWSLFQPEMDKEDNPPLSTGSSGGITGSRLVFDFHNENSAASYRIMTEMENTFESRTGDLPGYTRFFGTASWQMLYWYGSLIKFRVAGGYSKSDLPDQKSFRLGGVNTLRGFDPGAITASPSGNSGFTGQGGGDKMFLANIDYFYGQGISIIFFGDIGGVWRHDETVSSDGLRRDIGIGVALGSDFFTTVNENEKKAGFRVNWAIPVGPEPHKAHWTVNFIRAY